MTCHPSRLGYSALLLLLMWQDCKSGPQALLIPGTTSDLLRGTNGCSISVGFTQIILNKPEKSQALPSHETVSPNRFCSFGKAEFQAVFLPRGTVEQAVQHWLWAAQGQLWPSWATGFNWVCWRTWDNKSQSIMASFPRLYSQIPPLYKGISLHRWYPTDCSLQEVYGFSFCGKKLTAF